MKVFFLKSLNIFLVAICLFCYQSYAKNWQEREVISEETEKQNNYQDGSYQGTGDGFGGTITVEVAVNGGRISKITLISADGETKDYLEQAEKLTEDIIKRQSSQVDAVSGATYSSHGIIDAVRDALEKAGNS